MESVGRITFSIFCLGLLFKGQTLVFLYLSVEGEQQN